MAKEMFISSSPHETKVAVLEDDQLVEVYYERDTDVGLVGGIYKGRVNRVLPGMQSAFVDIGLERDAFLYVSDFFFEDQEEYDKVFEEAEARATRFSAEQAPAAETQPAPPAEPVSAASATAPAAGTETVSPPAQAAIPEPRPSEPLPAANGVPTLTTPASPPSEATGERHEYRRFDQQRGRRRRRRGRNFGEHRYGEHKFVPRQESTPPSFEILPGESLAKYSHAPSEGAAGEIPAPARAELAALEAASLIPQEPAGSFEHEPPVVSTAEASLPASPADAVADVKPPAPSLARELSPEATQEHAFPPPSFSPAAPLAAEQPAIAEPLQRASKESTTATPEPVTTPDVGQAAVPTEPPAANAGMASMDKAVATPEHTEEPVTPAVLPSKPTETSTTVATESPSVSEASPAPGAPLEVQEEAAHPEPVAGQTPAADSSGGTPERTYTLREPHQRPRFAPRRGRRGRRNMGHRPRSPEGKREPSRPGNQQPLQISELLKEGQEILVQIAKEPLGTKGARITCHVALPGRYLVYMPTIDHIGVSRKIASEEERLRLRNIIIENKGSLTGGFIVRTAGQGRSEDEFKADLKFLSTLWNDIRAKSEQAKAPALIHRDLDLVQRLLRDTLTPDFKSVRVDSETDYERVLDFVNRSQPSLVGKIKLYTRDTPLFEEFGVQAEIEKALKPKVWLKSGGYIVINQTEALVAVDVNTGKYVGKTNRLEDTIVKTNIDAVNEIVRQIRLRDLGGIIVIDFIDMDERKNRQKVVQALEEALRHDRAPTKVISFHDFGLVAITRKRVKQSLERTLCVPCTYCAGSGWIKSVTTVCYEILAEARKMGRQIEGDVLTLRVHPEVAKALKSREGSLVSELESLTRKEVLIKTDPTVHQERFEIF